MWFFGGRDPTVADLEPLPYTDSVVKETLRLYPGRCLLPQRWPLVVVALGLVA